MSDSYQAKVARGEISRAQFLRDMHRGNAHNEHPIGFRLKDSGLFDHECVVAYYKALGEPPPIPQVRVGSLVRRTIFQLEERGEIHQPRPTNYAGRAPYLYRLLHRSLVETSEQYVEYESGARVKLSDAELDRLRPQPIGTAPQREAARKRLLSGPIDFAGVVAGNIVFGTEVETGNTFMVDVRKLQHTICVGVSGSGKSVLLHLLVHQMMALPEFEQVILVDLKDGVEFNRYRDNSKAQVVWEFDDLVRVVDRLGEVARERAAVMREHRWQLWPHGRIALVIDEFAELQTEIDTAGNAEKKARAKQLSASLLSLARRARAFGIILICALQKATDDQMPSALRNNLGCRLVLRCGSSVTARSMLEIDDEYEALPVRPTRLRDGRLYYYDARRGDVRYLQAHVVAGVELG